VGDGEGLGSGGCVSDGALSTEPKVSGKAHSGAHEPFFAEKKMTRRCDINEDPVRLTKLTAR
jgi:hypothetical protein